MDIKSRKDYDHKYYLKNKDRIINRVKVYNLIHYKKIKEYQRGYQRNWYYLHKDKILARKKIRYDQSPQIFRLRKEKWRLQNLEICKEHLRKWRRKNPEKVKAFNQEKGAYYGRIRRARKYKAEGEHSIKEWEDLKKKFNFTCLACGQQESEIKLTEDHIIPLSKGGSDYIKNIQPLCGLCNRSKGTSIKIYEG